MLLFQEVPDAPVSKVGGAFGDLGGVDLGVSEVGQPFAIGCHPPCGEKENDAHTYEQTHIDIYFQVERSATFPK